MTTDRTLYRQCTLKRVTGKITQVHVAFIPAQFAVVGTRRKEGDWQDGWKVTFVGAAREGDDQRTWKRTRKHSDLSRGWKDQ